MARGNKTPMGILASSSGDAVGWCACGPRSRYAVADSGRRKILRDRDRHEDPDVWLLACMFVRTDCRAQGVTYALGVPPLNSRDEKVPWQSRVGP
jgi:hypothetical protein